MFFSVLGGWPSPFTGSALATRGLSRDSPRVPARTIKTARGYPRAILLQPAGYPRATKDFVQGFNLSHFSLWFCRMYVHWREREHEAANEAVAADPNVMAALTQCGLIKFFLCPFMRAQPRLLNALVDYWHPDADAFMIEGQSLMPTTEDIYFLTGLSRSGEPVNLRTFPTGERKVSELIAEYCVAGTNQRTSWIPVGSVTSLTLQAILSLIGRITGLTAVHQATRAQMNCAIQCMNAQIFDWSTTLLEVMKRQLTDCLQREHRNFGFGTILCSFFFERVPCFSPRMTVRGHLATFPAVCIWAALLLRQGGGRTVEAFNDDFFAWLSRQIPMIEDYPYAGIDFSRDPEMPVPPGEERGEIGKSPPILFFLFVCLYM
jgi:hypothetical protein